ncbi:hypothetical protein [Anaerosinus massiliensis]|uniref:hypothetical protein n=1 Tax=Massilibacillus massiliensis TaxID=1806837 RepID=UPI000DA61270|nr:hypothetical protein [Massilibacillus massiliensis]
MQRIVRQNTDVNVNKILFVNSINSQKVGQNQVQNNNLGSDLEENPAYMLQLMNEKENMLMKRFVGDSENIDESIDQNEFVAYKADKDPSIRKVLDDIAAQEFFGGNIESSIHVMLEPFNGHQDAWRNFGGAAQELNICLNNYSKIFGTDNNYYKELLEKLDKMDSEGTNSIVNYIKNVVTQSAHGEYLDTDPSTEQMKNATKAFDEYFGDLTLSDAKKKSRQMGESFITALGELSRDKILRIQLESKSLEELINKFMEEFHSEGETVKTSFMDVTELVNENMMQDDKMKSCAQKEEIKNIQDTMVGRSIVNVVI